MTITTDPDRLDRWEADELTARICANATRQARESAALITLIGEFDERGGLSFVGGAKSVAHWISFSCSMSPGTAREHVRVARALRIMPTVEKAFAEGELSYSKVREITRIVGLVDEARLCELAKATSASQLARTVAGYRTASGNRMVQQSRRRFALINTGDRDEMSRLSGRLPNEEAAIVAAALRRARDLNSTPPEPGAAPDATPAYIDADALLDICRHYLASAVTEDESGEDRGLVIVEVAAGLLDRRPVDDSVPAGTSTTLTVPSGEHNVPAGMSTPPTVPGGERDVPAGTPGNVAHDLQEADPLGPVCTIRGTGGIEPATAQRLTCTSTMLAAVINAHGDVLTLGRTRRLVSKAQRRALMLRDQQCQFPGCHTRHHLQAHHVVAWTAGGRTDLDNLILLCQYHHTTVHEGGISITRPDQVDYQAARTGRTGWIFTLPDGHVLSPAQPIPAEQLMHWLNKDARLSQLRDPITRHHPDAVAIRPKQYGERFNLHDAVRVLLGLELAQDQQAA